MFRDAFVKMDQIQAARLTELVNPHLDAPFDPEKTKVMIHNLPFYEGYFLAELSKHDQNPPVVRIAVCNDKGAVHVLNWTNDVIYTLNDSIPIRLTEDNMADYVRFFFNYVRGSHGRFIIVDSVDDIDWREEPAVSGRKALGKMIQPVFVKSREKDGSIVFGLSIVFRDSLFEAEAVLQKDGRISLRNEELLVEDIPVADDLFGQ